jgi:serine/threonine protein kinase
MSQRDARVIGGVYRTGQLISVGGILTIYTAYNHNTNDVVGLYIIEPLSPGQVQIVQQFQSVLDKRRLIRSPHVIRVYDWGIDGNRIFIITDPPRGVTLQYLFDHENIDLSRALSLTRQLAAGLQALHEQGLAGLDLRPQLITVNTVGVTDRVQIDDIGLRSLLLALGYVSNQRNDDIGYLDPRYTPPEYIYGGQVGPWSDIYQAGLHLFALATGRYPFIADTPAQTGIMQSTSPIPLMSQYVDAIPVMLQSLVEHALEKDPVKRFANASAFINALDNVILATQNEKYKNTPDTIVPPSSNINLATEMPQGDITKSTTLIEYSSGMIQTITEETIPNVFSEEGVYAYLCCQVNGDQPQRFAITQKSVIVGRLDPKRGVHPDIDLASLDLTKTISRLHARIRLEGTSFYIEDLKSQNKTRLGGSILTPLKAELLQHGDKIQFGCVHMTFEIPGMRKGPVFKNTQKI